MTDERQGDSLLRADRQSGIELLKLIGVFMIVISHSMPVAGEEPLFAPNIATPDKQMWAMALLCYLGNIGNLIFLISSSWFLTDDSRVKGKKVARIVGDNIFFSIVWLGITLLLGYDVSKKEMFRQLTPVTHGYNWFVSCYLVFYILHPLLNAVIASLTKKAHLKVICVMFVMYCGINFLKGGAYYYSMLVGFVVVYFFVAYAKRYLKNTFENKKLCLALAVFGALSNVALVIGTEILGVRIPIFSEKVMRWNSLVSPFCLCLVFGLFCLFKRLNFVNRRINALASLSLLIYIIHDNHFVYEWIRKDIFLAIRETYTWNHLFLWIIGIAVMTVVGATIVAAVYRMTLQKAVTKVADGLTEKIAKGYEKVSELLLKLD